MPPRRSLRQSAAAITKNEPIIISSSDDEKPVVEETDSSVQVRMVRRRTGSSLAASTVSTPGTSRSSRTNSTYASGSHTPATSVEDGGDNTEDIKDDLAAEATLQPGLRSGRPARSASLKSMTKVEAAPVSLATPAESSRKRKQAPTTPQTGVSSASKATKVEATDVSLSRAKSARGRASANTALKALASAKDYDSDDLDAFLDQELGPSQASTARITEIKDEQDVKGKGKGKAKAKAEVPAAKLEEDSDDVLEDANLTPRSRRQPRRSAASAAKPLKWDEDEDDKDELGADDDYFSDVNDYASPDDLTSDEEPLASKGKFKRSRPTAAASSTANQAESSTFATLQDMHFDSDPDATDEDEEFHPRGNNHYAEDIQYETAKQRQARLRSEKRNARLKKKDNRTQYDKNFSALIKHHPKLETVWEDLQKTVAVIKPEEAEQPTGLNIKLLPFQREGLYWMTRQEQGTWKGGMLADEMGMGKTIQMISLMLSDRKKPCLVIAPTVAIMQWRNEIEAYTEPKLKVLMWHGASRTQDLKQLKAADVVLTSYAVLESSFRKQESGFRRKGEILKEKSALHAVHWRRIILDEAHNIKERSTNTAKGAFALQATSDGVSVALLCRTVSVSCTR